MEWDSDRRPVRLRQLRKWVTEDAKHGELADDVRMQVPVHRPADGLWLPITKVGGAFGRNL